MKKYTTEVHLSIDEIELIIDALICAKNDLTFNPPTRKAMNDLKDQLEQEQ